MYFRLFINNGYMKTPGFVAIVSLDRNSEIYYSASVRAISDKIIPQAKCVDCYCTDTGDGTGPSCVCSSCDWGGPLIA